MEKSNVMGVITGINGNMITVRVDGRILQNELAYAICGDERLKAEIIKIEEGTASLQVYESTRGLRAGDQVEFSGQMLFVRLGPGILGQVYDGLQNPLHELAKQHGFFLRRGKTADPLDRVRKWMFRPEAKEGDVVLSGMALGRVQENAVRHSIMVPFTIRGECTVKSIVPEGQYTIEQQVAEVVDEAGVVHSLTMCFDWPIKLPIKAYRRKLV